MSFIQRVPMAASLKPLFNENWEYVSLRGGRGSGKTLGMIDAALITDLTEVNRTLCAREFQATLKESMHRAIVDRIYALKLQGFYTDITDSAIRGRNGSEYIFKGLRKDINSLRSIYGITRTIIDEAQSVTRNSWSVLIPSVMRSLPGSNRRPRMWLGWNPDLETDPTYVDFVTKPRPTSIDVVMNWRDNPFFEQNPGLEAERKWTLERDPVAYANTWDGHPRKLSEAVIFATRIAVAEFDPPPGTTFYFGADFGFAKDPSALVRCWIDGDCLFIDHEAWGIGVEIDETAGLFAGNPPPGCGWTNYGGPHGNGFPGVPGAAEWPIIADNSRPETISFLANQGLNISPVEKWPGSVEDGIAHLKAFRRIYVHARCKRLQEEFRLYSYRVDTKTGRILPKPADLWNHLIDALRYALNGFIQRRGEETVWTRMLEQ